MARGQAVALRCQLPVMASLAERRWCSLERNGDPPQKCAWPTLLYCPHTPLAAAGTMLPSACAACTPSLWVWAMSGA